MSTDDIDPALALEILPEKIRKTRLAITEAALDLSVIGELEGHSEQDAEFLTARVRFQRRLLAAYEARLRRIQRAAAGEPDEDESASPQPLEQQPDH
jgi:hypothetical protein